MIRARNVAVLVGGAATLKVIQITLNDDWEHVMYRFRKSFQKQSAFDIVKDVKINYTKNGRADKPKVVILGTGWGAMSFLQSLDQDDIEVTIISPRSFFFYTPLLAGTAVGTVR
jgi:hypothetical protein